MICLSPLFVSNIIQVVTSDNSNHKADIQEYLTRHRCTQNVKRNILIRISIISKIKVKDRVSTISNESKLDDAAKRNQISKMISVSVLSFTYQIQNHSENNVNSIKTEWRKDRHILFIQLVQIGRVSCSSHTIV